MSITRNSTFSNFAKKIIRDPPYNLFMISKVLTLPPAPKFGESWIQVLPYRKNN